MLYKLYKQRKWIVGVLLLIAMIFMKGNFVKADTWAQTAYSSYLLYNDFGTPSISYTVNYYNGMASTGANGSWVTNSLNTDGSLDARWLNAVYLHNTGTGGYASMSYVGIKAHLHNYGWTDMVDGSNGLIGTNYTKYGWMEAIQLSAASSLGQYAYLSYGVISNPLTWPYIVWKSGGEEHDAAVGKPGDFPEAERNLLANNPTAQNATIEGHSVYKNSDGSYRFFLEMHRVQ